MFSTGDFKSTVRQRQSFQTLNFYNKIVMGTFDCCKKRTSIKCMKRLGVLYKWISSSVLWRLATEKLGLNVLWLGRIFLYSLNLGMFDKNLDNLLLICILRTRGLWHKNSSGEPVVYKFLHDKRRLEIYVNWRHFEIVSLLKKRLGSFLRAFLRRS